MKRILALIIALAILCAVAVPSVFAEESFNTVMEYTNPSNYQIVIPETIDAGAEHLTFEAYSMNILDTEKITIKLDGNNPIELAKEDDANFTAQVIIDCKDGDIVGEFYKDELSSHYNNDISMVVQNANQIPAGKYSGSVSFTISLSDRA